VIGSRVVSGARWSIRVCLNQQTVQGTAENRFHRSGMMKSVPMPVSPVLMP